MEGASGEDGGKKMACRMKESGETRPSNGAWTEERWQVGKTRRAEVRTRKRAAKIRASKNDVRAARLRLAGEGRRRLSWDRILYQARETALGPNRRSGAVIAEQDGQERRTAAVEGAVPVRSLVGR
jgi:hypothetical protein